MLSSFLLEKTHRSCLWPYYQSMPIPIIAAAGGVAVRAAGTYAVRKGGQMAARKAGQSLARKASGEAVEQGAKQGLRGRLSPEALEAGVDGVSMGMDYAQDRRAREQALEGPDQDISTLEPTLEEQELAPALDDGRPGLQPLQPDDVDMDTYGLDMSQDSPDYSIDHDGHDLRH
jgi:hypothetical protein